MGDDRAHDPHTARRRRLQFRYATTAVHGSGEKLTDIVVDLGIYPMSFFTFLLSVGLLVTRARRKRLNIPPSEYRAWDIAVAFSILSNLYMLVAPWYPPTTGATGGDVSFWYATYCVVGLGMYVLSLSIKLLWSRTVADTIQCGFVRSVLLRLDQGAPKARRISIPTDYHPARWGCYRASAGEGSERPTGRVGCRA